MISKTCCRERFDNHFLVLVGLLAVVKPFNDKEIRRRTALL